MTAQGDLRSEAAMDAEFVDLMCADEDLLRAEFDAIIAAEFPDQPPSSPSGACRGARARHVRPARRWAARDVALRTQVAATERVTRQRSPPLDISRLSPDGRPCSEVVVRPDRSRAHAEGRRRPRVLDLYDASIALSLAAREASADRASSSSCDRTASSSWELAGHLRRGERTGGCDDVAGGAQRGAGRSRVADR
jgi:hypothetical protein